MLRSELNEAIEMLQAVAIRLSDMATTTSDSGADLRRACNGLSGNARTLLQTATLGQPTLECFRAAHKTGATSDDFNRLRAYLTGLSPVYGIGVIVRQMLLRMCLSEESRAVSNTTFTSRDQVESCMSRMLGSFGETQDYAADNQEPDVFQAMVALQAAVARDLSVRARPLPKMVSFSYPKRPNALALANRLYGDADRADELIGENKPVHPAFMPPTGRALSS